ncbi:MAG: hypothetical protein GX224_02380 [Thermoplasmatales archaeon]|nr:hypothetical protein [Thermoplasmatales archaeon]
MILSIEATYDSEKIAKAVFAAIGPDNEGYVESTLDGKKIRFEIRAESVGALRNTADDLLACLGTAEAAAGLAIRADDPETD